MSRGRWFIRGLAQIASTPALILLMAFTGFAGLAKESGFSLDQALLMGCLIWALPAQVVLIGSMLSGASLWVTAFAVSLSSVRLLPMVVSLLPVIREKETPRWQLFVMSHFIAITVWVFAVLEAPNIPRYGRIAFLIGFGCSLMIGSSLAMTGVYYLLDRLPPIVAGALFFLMPVYFLTSLYTSAKKVSDRLALIFGLLLGPVFFLWLPGLDLLWTGLVGGTAAFLIPKLGRKYS